MQFVYLDRRTDRRKAVPDVLARLVDEFGPCFVVPEGGSNALGVRGCAELSGEIDANFDVICYTTCSADVRHSGLPCGIAHRAADVVASRCAVPCPQTYPAGYICGGIFCAARPCC